MTIHAGTKIAPILKQNAAALDAIVSISPAFEKLRNPLLRKLMAGRTSLTMAAKFGHCTVNDFFQKLEPLGFIIDKQASAEEETKAPLPSFITTLSKQQLVELDVRPILASGKDPLNEIMEMVKTVLPGQALKIINTFEPTPLMRLLEKKGFTVYADKINDNLVETYFYKSQAATSAPSAQKLPNASGWQALLESFNDRLVKIDVRHLEMPQPMHTILEALDQLSEGSALYVYHKRIPVFLLPELAERGFEYRVNEVTNGEVHLLIFKK